jgi:hypothetical protein
MLLCRLLACTIPFAAAVAADEPKAPQEAPARPPWKLGQGWHMTAKLYPRGGTALAGDPEPRASYSLHIIPAEVLKVNDTDCWKLEVIIPGKQAPAGIADRYRILLGKADLLTRRLFRTIDQKPAHDDIEEFDKLMLVITAPEGFPLELFPVEGPARVTHRGLTTDLTISRRDDEEDEEAKILEARFKTPAGQEVLVRQKWHEGKNFWSEYDRWLDGRLDLSVRPYEKPKPPPSGPTGPYKEPPPSLETDPLRLHADRRLQIHLTFSMPIPKAPDLLKKLQGMIGVPLAVDERVDATRPVLGGVSVFNTPAWKLMLQIAQSKEMGVAWEKTDDGYRLVSTDPLPAPEPAPLVSRDAKVLRWSLVGATLAALAVAAIVFALRRRRDPLAADRPSTPDPGE